MTEEDRGFCVYVHKRNDTDEIVYVGEGRLTRAKKTREGVNCSGKNREYVDVVNSVGVYMEVYKDGLTKLEAIELENELINSMPTLTNKNKHHTYGRELLAKDYCELFYIDSTSPSGIRWKVDRYTHGDKGALVVRKGDVVGCKNSKGYWVTGNRPTHRIVYALHYGVCPAHMTIDHIDKNKDNNCISNLELVSAGENSRRNMKSREYIPRGSDVSTSKVKEQDVLKMYEMFEIGCSNQDVADVFGLHDRYVSLIRHGKRWEWLYSQFAKSFTKSSKAIVYEYSLVREAVYLLLIGLSNKEISTATGIEVSSISRLRHNKTLSVYREKALKELCESCQ